MNAEILCPLAYPQICHVLHMILQGSKKIKLEGYASTKRRGKLLKRAAPVLSALFCLIVASSAQDLSSSNVFAGYSFIGANLYSGQHVNLNGWHVSAEKKYLPFFGVVADFTGLYGSKDVPANSCADNSQACLVHASVNEYSYQFGIRGSYPAPRVRPFAEALFGGIHTGESGPGLPNSNTGFAATLGGGMDCRLTRLLGCRVVVDYIVTGSFYARQNSIRASTGLVVRF